MKTKNEIMVKPYTLLELSELYGVSVKTLRNWILPIKKKVGVRRGRFYTVKQTEMFFRHFGLPYYMEIKKIDKLMLEIESQN